MKQIALIALASRCSLLSIQFIANLLIPDHNSEDAFQGIDNTTTIGLVDEITFKVLCGLNRWDGLHFMHIAKYGYTYENNLAFFPAFPFILWGFKSIFLFPFSYFLSEISLLLLASTLLNTVLFVLSAVILYKLTAVVLMNQILAYYSTLLFCINPASIFFIAPYSESLFTFCTFCGLLLLEFNSSPLIVALVFAAGSSARANGIINVGFIIFKILLRFQDPKKARILRELAETVLSTIIVLSPFFVYQMYAHRLFCDNPEVSLPLEVHLLAIKEKYILPGSDPIWCEFTPPLSYPHIQKKYWNVGFLNYYELKQIPNFLLAAPVLFLCFYNSAKFILNHKNTIKNNNSFFKLSSYSLRLFPYVVHVTFLSVFCLLCAHVQIATRMLASASPIFYWYASSVLVNNSKVLKRRIEKSDFNNFHNFIKSSLLLTELQPLNSKPIFVKYYFLSYFAIGAVLFSNHLPWT